MKAVNNTDVSMDLCITINFYDTQAAWVTSGRQFCVPQIHIYILKLGAKLFRVILWSSKEHRLVYNFFPHKIFRWKFTDTFQPELSIELVFFQSDNDKQVWPSLW